jgi:rhodanese-related sulfurtransferase
MKALFLFAVALASLTVPALSADPYPTISMEDLKTAITEKRVTILQIPNKSYPPGRIPGSIDFRANRDRLASLLPADKTALVVAYCGSEHCMEFMEAADAAIALGYTNVKRFAPGIKGWRDAGGLMEGAEPAGGNPAKTQE